ncbi:MAG: hypothetical protein ABIP29_09035, partial [Candidatus Eisenbacteria bacterium]
GRHGGRDLTMDDRFLHEARREPRPEFTAALRQRLAQDDHERHARSFGRSRALRRGLFVFAPAVAAALALVLFPEVRAGAQAFLELFRVRNFVAVNVDPERMKALHKDGVDPLSLVGEHVETSPPEPSRGFDTPAAAFLAAGYGPREPSYLPRNLKADSAILIGAREGELRVHAAKVNELLATLGIGDLSIPPALDGARIAMRSPRAVMLRYRDGKEGGQRAMLAQAPHPEIALPAGIDRARLAEIGLRIAGLSPDEARRFADRIDWNSTVLVPVPFGKCTFREVEVAGRKALLIEEKEDGAAGKSSPRNPHGGRVLLWSDDERVFALTGNLPDYDMLQVAGSIP